MPESPDHAGGMAMQHAPQLGPALTGAPPGDGPVQALAAEPDAGPLDPSLRPSASDAAPLMSHWAESGRAPLQRKEAGPGQVLAQLGPGTGLPGGAAARMG